MILPQDKGALAPVAVIGAEDYEGSHDLEECSGWGIIKLIKDNAMDTYASRSVCWNQLYPHLLRTVPLSLSNRAMKEAVPFLERRHPPTFPSWNLLEAFRRFCPGFPQPAALPGPFCWASAGRFPMGFGTRTPQTSVLQELIQLRQLGSDRGQGLT